ncbi:hypothetical protein TCAL_02618 [Tigriopus californicus]|uniref:Ileal sodium/bile acid cotransporter n=1 Tax=Tigriopus californicus TaxID=6832 RepID=A0A553NFT1_TIGCA|nr:ileal sodium/bile acid cotransporter-like [Tigriopus californicus]TRY64297.1 hypothetical protein TCAL_02618 [Tigriopus californicus]|eukprot:TCALIF_02618-PA protein Name:"Similar to Slc10a6 Solute carrier family 10 member 6 (Rattus norvegicus)" AED:0.01 eAED:0.01 QI:251/1/1/1/0.33/0.28/7/103/569
MALSPRLVSWCFSCVLLTTGAWTLKVEYDTVEPIAMNHFQNITLRLSFNESINEEQTWPANQGVNLTFSFEDKVSWALDALNASLIATREEIRLQKAINLTVKGVIIGYNNLEVYGQLVTLNKPGELPPAPNSPVGPTNRPPFNPRRRRIRKTTTTATAPAPFSGEFFNNDYDYYYDDYASIQKRSVEEESSEDSEGNEKSSENHAEFEPAVHTVLSEHEPTLMRKIHIVVMVKDQTMNDLFTLVMTLMIIANTVNMGGQLDLQIIKEVFKKPIGPLVGMICQFILMPLFAYAIGWLMTNDTLFRLGLFVLGCCPGGTGSNFWCILLKGDINLSITMTFVSTVAALGMMPMWLWLMGPLLTDEDLVIPFGQLMITLISLIAPIAVGMLIRYKWIKAAAVMDKIIVPFTLLTVFFIFTVGVYVNLFIFQLITWPMVAAGFMVAGAGYFFGAGLAWLCRLEWDKIVAVSIETAFQNGGIAFILLKVSLEAPYGELASVAPVAQLVITGLPLWAALGVWKLYEKCCSRKKVEAEPVRDEYKPIQRKDVENTATDGNGLTKTFCNQETQTQLG